MWTFNVDPWMGLLEQYLVIGRLKDRSKHAFNEKRRHRRGLRWKVKSGRLSLDLEEVATLDSMVSAERRATSGLHDRWWISPKALGNGSLEGFIVFPKRREWKEQRLPIVKRTMKIGRLNSNYPKDGIFQQDGASRKTSTKMQKKTQGWRVKKYQTRLFPRRENPKTRCTRIRNSRNHSDNDLWTTNRQHGPSAS